MDDSNSSSPAWQTAFDKVRVQQNAGVAAVRRPAVLLNAIDSTLQQQQSTSSGANQGKITPSSYLVALLSTLNQLCSDADSSKSGTEKRELLQACLYLLSILLPHLEPATVRQHATNTLIPAMIPLFKSFHQDAPVLKSLITISHHSIASISNSKNVLEKDLNVRTGYAELLSLCDDARPKVRRKAQETIHGLLSSPPPPAVFHPYASESANWILNKLSESIRSAKRGGKAVAAPAGKGEKKALAAAKAVGGDVGANTVGGSGSTGDESKAIALLTFIRNLGTAWDDEATPTLLPILLSTLTLSSQHLTLAALTLLSHLFSASRSAEALSPTSVQETLDALLEARPRGGEGETNEKLSAGWLEGVGEGMVAYARTNSEQASAKTKELFGQLLPILSSAQTPALRQASETTLEMFIRHCLLDKDIIDAVQKLQAGSSKSTESGSTTLSIIESVEKAITSPRFAAAAQPHVLALAKALFLRLRVRIPSAGSRSEPTASILLRKILVLLSKLREDSHFEWKRALEDVLDAAIKVCGPELVLTILPLGLEEGSNPTKARAWLLPLLKPAITNTRLGHFKSTFLPLSAQLFEKAEKAKANEKGMEAKVWETLVGQIWGLLPGYCEYPIDLVDEFDAEFLGVLANVVYAQPNLRPAVFKALSTLVSTTSTLAASTSPADLLHAQFGLTPEQGRSALQHLRALASTVLGVSFNVYGKMSRGEGGYILTTVGDWLAILPFSEIESTYASVTGLLAQAIEAQVPIQKGSAKETDAAISPTHALLDILITLIPYAQPIETRFFDLACEKTLLASQDVAIQKKAYRILARLTEERAGAVVKRRVGEVLEQLVENKGGVAQGAKRDRTLLLSTLVPLLPSDSLHHIPSLIPEAVLGTKESNERTREAAYELIVGMAKKMAEGGVLARHKVKGMRDETDDEAAMEEDEVPASVEEFVTMLSAGLAGSSPHMISATITSLSRIIFEFHKDVPEATLQELVSTLVVFLSSANREIVRSALGFIKVSLVSLPASLISPSLPELVPNLINWSHEHSNHFKVKTRHLFERMIRKFGYDQVERYVPEDDKKLVSSIRKKQARSKKKRAADAEAKDEDNAMGSDAEPAPRANTRSAYDEVLYGSDSDDSGSDDENAVPTPGLTAPSGVKNRKSQMRKQKRDEGTFIHEDEDEVLDLLDDQMMSNISAARATKSNHQKELKSNERHFKTDTKSGKIRVTEDSDSDDDGRRIQADNEMADGGQAASTSAMGAYFEAMRGEDGHTQDAKGKVKFNKTQGKRGRGTAFEEDDEALQGVEELGARGGKKKAKNSKRETVRVGAEFKAKRAGGDIKKNGMEPYAFVPLQSVAGKKVGGRSQAKIGLTGLKRAGGRK